MGVQKDWTENSTRCKIIKPILYNGVIPYSCLKYFIDHDTEMLRRVVRKMDKKEGILSIATSPTGKKYIRMKQLKTLSEETLAELPQEYLEWYRGGMAVKRREKAMAKTDCDRVLQNADASVFLNNVGAKAYAPDRKEFLLCESKDDYLGCYFPSYELKQQNTDVEADVFTDNEGNKIVFASGCSGAYITDNAGYYLIYDVGKKSIRWDSSEEKMYKFLERRFSRDQNIRCNGMIFLYEDDVRTSIPDDNGVLSNKVTKEIGTNLLLSVINDDGSKKRGRYYLTMKNWQFEAGYFLPQSAKGIKLMQIMSEEKWKERIREMFLPKDVFKPGRGECDAMMQNGDGKTFSYVDLFCIPDMAQLYRFYTKFKLDESDRVIQMNPENKNQYIIICFDFQENFIRKLFGGSENVTILSNSFEGFFEKYTQSITESL